MLLQAASHLGSVGKLSKLTGSPGWAVVELYFSPTASMRRGYTFFLTSPLRRDSSNWIPEPRLWKLPCLYEWPSSHLLMPGVSSQQTEKQQMHLANDGPLCFSSHLMSHSLAGHFSGMPSYCGIIREFCLIQRDEFASDPLHIRGVFTVTQDSCVPRIIKSIGGGGMLSFGQRAIVSPSLPLQWNFSILLVSLKSYKLSCEWVTIVFSNKE